MLSYFMGDCSRLLFLKRVNGIILSRGCNLRGICGILTDIEDTSPAKGRKE